MSDSDSDTNVSMVRVSSIKGHKTAPDTVEYKIILKNINNNKLGFSYTLKKGQELPFAREMEGNISCLWVSL